MAGYTLKAEEFQQWVEADADKFQPVGEKLHEYDLGQPSTKYIITKVRLCVMHFRVCSSSQNSSP